MSWFDAFRHRLRSAIHRDSADRERDEEYALHQTLDAQQRAHGGTAPDEARFAAHREFGNATYLREEVRWMGAARWLDAAWQDLRYGARALRRSPVFTLVVVASLGIGIGANAVIFGAIDALVLARVQVPHADELRLVSHTPDANSRAFFPAHETQALRTASGVELSSIRPIRIRGADVNGVPIEDPSIDIVDGAFFKLLGVRAAAGRLIGEADVNSALPVAVVSYRLAKAHYRSADSAIGKTMTIDGAPFTVIGVTVAGYEGVSFGSDYGIAIPSTALSLLGDGRRAAQPDAFLLTRFRGDSAKVHAALDAVFAACCAEAPPGLPGARRAERRIGFIDVSHGINEGKKIDVRAQYTNPLIAMMAGVAVLLLIACTNVGNLLMARATSRSRELAVRLSLGASRGRIVRQLLVEALLLAALGAAAGLMLAIWGSAVLSRNLPAGMENLGPFIALRPGLSVFLFTAAVALACALVFGVVPAVRATRRGVSEGLRDQRGSARTPTVERGLVAVQVGLALVLVSAAGLLVATLRHLSDSVGGSNPETLLVVQLDARGTPHSDTALTLLRPTLQRRFESVAGVKSVAQSYVVPLIYGGLPTDVLDLPGFENTSDEQMEVASFDVGPGYFATLGINIIAGRDFNSSDVVGTQRVAVISENVASHFFPGRNPVGALIGFRSESRNIQIIGVVGDAKQTNLRAPAPRTVYLASAQSPAVNERAVFAVRTTVDPREVALAVRAAVLEELPRISIRHMHPMSDLLTITTARERSVATLALVFGVLAVALAAIGLYGVMAFQVSARTREIGVRMALGASQSQVVRMVLRQALSVVAVGVAIGVPLTLAGTRSIRALLYGVTPFDPAPVVLGAAVLVAVGIAASFLPSRTAARVDPLIAIRAD